MVALNFDIFKALYRETEEDETFLKNRFIRSILDLAILFGTLLQIASNIWLPAVEHGYPSFFQRNRILDLKWEIFHISSKSVEIEAVFSIFVPDAKNCFKCYKKGRFPTFWYKAFSSKMSFSEYEKLTWSRISNRELFSNFDLIGCKSTKSARNPQFWT